MIDESERQQNILEARQFHEAAYKAYWDVISTTPPGTLCLLSFDLVETVEKAGWRPGGGQIVADDVRELINTLNTWASHLFRWEIWQQVLANYASRDDLWSLRDEFVEPIAHCCLLRPSQIRDVFVRIATSAVHHANLICDPTTQDELEGEREGRTHLLSRKKRESQLQRIGAKWCGLPRLLQAVQSLDSKECRQKTLDYRNRASHSVAPHFEEGMQGLVTRQFGHPSLLVEHGDGTYLTVEDSTRKVPYYTLGYIPPLNLSEMLEINNKEFATAVEAFESYQALLSELHLAFPKANESK